jgi:UDP-N-acetylglucosamine acyltransferase
VNDVHPTAVVGSAVTMGQGNVVGPYVVILGPVSLGDGNWIGPHVVIGTPAEIRGSDHGRLDGHPTGAHGPGVVSTGIRIGHRNVVREFTTIHQGHYAQTVVGDDCYLMNKVYVGHDSVLGDGVTVAATATLGGHVHVGPAANLGMGAIVHQRRVIGPGVMVGMGAVVTRDIPPYALSFGNPSRLRGVNRVGLDRAGMPSSAIEELERAYAAGTVPSAGMSEPGLVSAWAWWRAEMASRD